MSSPSPGDIAVFVGPFWSYEPVPVSPDGFGSIIYKPGIASAADTVETWPEVQAFIAQVHGKGIVYVDDSITSPAPILAATATTECFGRIELRPYDNDPETATVLQIEGGATLLDLYAIVGNLELRCNPSSPATPSLDWTTSPNGGCLVLAQNATLSNASSATGPIANIADNEAVSILMDTASLIVNNPDHALFSIADGGALTIKAFNDSVIDSNYASGNGGVSLYYDMTTASSFNTPGTPPSVTIGSLYLTKNLDDLTIEQTFTTSTINNDVFQVGPQSGIRPVTFKGVGGGGGGGGGSGGDATDGGTGGSAGGAAAYQELTVDVDFSHSINIVVDAGGPGGAGGSAGGGTGADGADGGPTYVLDTTTNIVLCCFFGASGGQGASTSGGGPTALASAGSNISGQQYAEGTGFVGAGGVGGGSTTAGSAGVANAVSIGAILSVSTPPYWTPGAGGTSAVATDGGGGGGGGQGVYGNGGNGGNCTSGVTTAGGSPLPGSAAGGGGGAGGASSPVTPGDGSSGGNGGSGQITSSFRP